MGIFFTRSVSATVTPSSGLEPLAGASGRVPSGAGGGSSGVTAAVPSAIACRIAAQSGPVRVQDAARGGERESLHRIEVLDADRDAGQQRGGVTVACPPFVGGARVLASALGVEPHPSVDPVRDAVERRLPAVALRDAAQA